MFPIGGTLPLVSEDNEQEDLGLTLVKTKAPITIIIDSIENKPTNHDDSQEDDDTDHNTGVTTIITLVSHPIMTKITTTY